MVHLTVDPGSTHMGKLNYMNELIRIAKNCGADAIKWQLGRLKPPNIQLPTKNWRDIEEECKRVGIECYASVWDQESLDWYMKNATNRKIKFAFSQNKEHIKMQEARQAGMEVIVSCDCMTDRQLSRYCTKLYCIPDYPLRYKPNFDGIFPRFDGFSSHALGTEVPVEAVKYGCKRLEVHLTLDNADVWCADGMFAYTPKELEKLVKALK